MSRTTPPPVPNTQPRRKRSGCLTAMVALVGLFIALLAVGFYATKQTEAELERADDLWAAGQSEEAVAIYTREFEWVEDDRLPETYKRIITHHYDSSDAATAAEWAGRAVEGGIDVRFGRDDLDRLIAAAKQAADARRAEVEVAKRAEEQRRAEAEAARRVEEKRLAEEREQARRAEEQRLAERREQARLADEQRLAEERERYRAEMNQFYKVVAATGRHGVIAELDSSRDRTLTITVNDRWGALPNATRLEYARTFRGAWLGIWNPDPRGGPAKVQIEIHNEAGKSIGGGSWSEDAVWVD